MMRGWDSPIEINKSAELGTGKGRTRWQAEREEQVEEPWEGGAGRRTLGLWQWSVTGQPISRSIGQERITAPRIKLSSEVNFQLLLPHFKEGETQVRGPGSQTRVTSWLWRTRFGQEALPCGGQSGRLPQRRVWIKTELEEPPGRDFALMIW